MSVEISPVEGAAAATSQAQPPPPPLELRTYSAGVEISSGARQYFFPYKTIQFVQLERRPGAWILHIRTDRDKINLTSSRDLDADFRALMIAYRT